MNNYQHQTPPPVTRHHHHQLPPPPPLPHHHPSVLPQPQQPLPMVPATQQHVHQQPQPQPLISNSLAIRQEIQRFESVHPSIYAIYDLIDLLPIGDAQIAQQIRDHVVCIEGQDRGLILNSQARKAVKNFVRQMPCGWPELGVPALAPYTNSELNLHGNRSIIDSVLQFIRLRVDGLDRMDIKKMKVSYTFSKKVKYHFVFRELKATAHILNTNTFIDALSQLGLSVRYEGSGPLEFALKDLSIEGKFKYKMPILWGSIKIYKFEATVTLGGIRSNIGGLLGDGKLNRFLNDQLEAIIPNYINSHQKEISAEIENVIVPRINDHLKGHKVWWLLGQMIKSTNKCNPTPAPWLALE